MKKVEVASILLHHHQWEVQGAGSRLDNLEGSVVEVEVVPGWASHRVVVVL